MIQNCIGLSRHCVLTRLKWAKWHFLQNESLIDSFYRQKLKWVLSTLPNNYQYLHKWLEYELREEFLYGLNYLDFKKSFRVPEPLIYKLPSKNLWSTMTTHNYESSHYYKNYWPQIKHVSLTNCNKFGSRSLILKNKEVAFDYTWAKNGYTPRKRCFSFDIDSCIFNTTQFAKQVRELYDYLEFDDFQFELIEKYHSEYIKLHKHI